MAVSLLNLTPAGVIWEEELSVGEFTPSYWLVGVFVDHFLG